MGLGRQVTTGYEQTPFKWLAWTAILVTVAVYSPHGLANAKDRGIVQSWDVDYTAREWLMDRAAMHEHCNCRN